MVRAHGDPLRVLVTGAGAPGISGTLYALRHNPDGTGVYVVGTDLNPNAVGRHLVDAFATVSAPEDDGYLDALLEICERERVEVVLPQTTREVAVLTNAKSFMAGRGFPIAVADAEAIAVANDKARLLRLFADEGWPHPAFHLAHDAAELEAHVGALGYPETPVVVKPPLSNGMRGFRVLRESGWDVDRFLREKPSGVETSLAQLAAVLARGAFPRLLVTEYLPGPEYTVDAFRGMEGSVAVPRRRDAVRSGISFDTRVELRTDLEHITLQAAERIGLTGAFGFQFKLDGEGIPKVLECNPRVQGTMVASVFAGVNCVWLAVQEARGRQPVPPEPHPGDVRFARYWGGMGLVDGVCEGSI